MNHTHTHKTVQIGGESLTTVLWN